MSKVTIAAFLVIGILLTASFSSVVSSRAETQPPNSKATTFPSINSKLSPSPKENDSSEMNEEIPHISSDGWIAIGT